MKRYWNSFEIGFAWTIGTLMAIVAIGDAWLVWFIFFR